MNIFDVPKNTFLRALSMELQPKDSKSFYLRFLTRIHVSKHNAGSWVYIRKVRNTCNIFDVGLFRQLKVFWEPFLVIIPIQICTI